MAQANGVNARGKKKSVYLTICGIIVIMLITIALLAGCGDSSSDASGDTSASGATEGSGPAGGPMGGPMGGMGMGGMGMGMPGMMGGGAGASAAASAAVEEPAAPPAKPYPGTPEQIRSDPFVALPNPLGGGAGGARNQSLTNVMLPLPLLPEGGINIESVSGKETQTRRAAGILWGNDAYGLLQIGEETYIVQTGDEVAGYTVTGITPRFHCSLQPRPEEVDPDSSPGNEGSNPGKLRRSVCTGFADPTGCTSGDIPAAKQWWRRRARYAGVADGLRKVQCSFFVARYSILAQSVNDEHPVGIKQFRDG